MEFKGFRKIRQFKDAIQSIRLSAQYVGKDDEGRPIYDENAPLPTVTFKGTVKLHGCVSGDTKVTMVNGSTEYISDLMVGDKILSYDVKNGRISEDEVTAVISDELDKEWVELEFDDGHKLQCTEDHPILTQNRGFVSAIDLIEDDIIVNYW